MTPFEQFAGDQCLDIANPKFEIGSINNSNLQTGILRLASREFNQPLIRPTLKQTLELAKVSATTELRGRIEEWFISLLKQNDADTISRIQGKIKAATQALAIAQVGSAVSNFTTYLSLPVALLGDVAPLSDLATAIGWDATVLGFAGLLAFDSTKRALRWATFGSAKPSKD